MSSETGFEASLFAGRSIVVVGAGSGIGRTCASHLASLGASVACLDLVLDSAEATACQICADGGTAWAAMIDVTQVDSVSEVMADTISRFGVLDGLLNTAGITGTTNILAHEVDVNDFDHVYRVNLRGALLLTQAVIPHMVERNYGRIVHFSSIAGKDGNAGMTSYSASKAGLIGLVKTMGKEYATNGITINAVAPAVVQTPMVDALPQAQIDYMTEKIPMGRTGGLQEVAYVAAFALSSMCSFTTGFTFDLTGGRAVY